jgi:3-isopropylmalate dehydrogenase
VKPRVAVIAGDGIGPEVIGKALEECDLSLDLVWIDAGAERFLDGGELLDEEDLTNVRDSDALLFGAVGDQRVPDGVLEQGILLRLRKELDLYVNLRPFPEIDVAIVRENSEGLYAGASERRGDLATETSVNTRAAIERCARYAFRLAERRRGHVTWVHKTNVLVAAGSLWREVVLDVGADHPAVEVVYEHADAAAYHLVTDTARFDVILTDNLFGDLLSDVAAARSGGLGRAASANLHPDRATRRHRCVGMFEPVHGSAPDIAGTGRADPTAAARALDMLLAELFSANSSTRQRALRPTESAHSA